MSKQSKSIEPHETNLNQNAGIRWLHSLYAPLEKLTRKWWFYVLLFVVPLFILPISSSRGLTGPSDVGPLIWELTDTWLARKAMLVPYQPFFHLAIVLLIAGIYRWGNKFAKFYSIIVGVHILTITYFQGFGVTENYGNVLVTFFAIWFLFGGLPWIWDAFIRKTDFTFKRLPLWRYWVIPFAILAFWDPDQTWDLDPGMFLYSASPTAASMMIPIYLSVFSLLYPKVNMVAFRLMSFTGIIYGVLSVAVGIFKEGDDAVYWTLLHVPQIFVSLYCFVLSLRAKESNG